MTAPTPTVIEEARRLSEEFRQSTMTLSEAFAAAIELGERRADADAVGWLRTNPGVLVSLPDPGKGPFSQQDATVAEIRNLDAAAIERGDHRSKPA